MKIEKEFTLLKIELKIRTDKDGLKSNYLIVSALDENLVPCNFFVFKDDTVDSIIKESSNVKPLSKVLIDFDLTYNGKLWNVSLNNILFDY